MDEKKNAFSRRDFMKSGSVFLLSKIAFDDPGTGLLAQALGAIAGDAKNSFSCGLFRGADLLSLKFYFFNAKTSFGRLRRIKKLPLYIYIKLPSQHVAEELVNEAVERIANRAFFQKMKSFSAENSWLAFKLTDKRDSIPMNAESLLNWSKYFDLITVDDFAIKDPGHFSGYQYALPLIKKRFREKLDRSEPVWFDDSRGGPLTNFELPYKMLLSPIAPPFLGSTGDLFQRSLGEHIFSGGNELKVYYSAWRKYDYLKLVSPWQNQLIFRGKDGTVSSPRFKVVSALCQDPQDNGVQLLPAPINRDELNELTMQADFDRDVLSEFFKVSSIGATTNLKYRNDDPQKFALIGWEQRIKFGHDNYVSVTFRAIDVITGLKLLVSTVSSREFKHGVSFMPKLYHVAYMEREKVYNTDLVISRLPFTKITAKSQGAFFYPQDFDKIVPLIGSSRETDGSYLVSRSKPENAGIGRSERYDVFDSAGNIQGENLLDFEYEGLDKNGNLHKFKSKIIFISAESYEISEGVFNYVSDDGVPGSLRPFAAVKITDIWQLNPSRKEGLNDADYAQCEKLPSDTYKFQLSKLFSVALASEMRLRINKLAEIVSKPGYRDTLGIKIGTELTFARLEGLKKDALIRADSTNTTFNTKDVLLVPEYNPRLTGIDFFFDRFPLLPTLHNAFVTISQIDQIQGKNEFHGVRYYDDYKNSKVDLDQHRKADQAEKNIAMLFFSLEQPINNFFTENYKSSGAVANPGLKISHVSALDNSIGYNESHNKDQASEKLVGGIKVVGAASSDSIFREFKAEILGIPLVKVLQTALGVDDLPVMAYARQLEQTIQRIQDLKNEFGSLVSGWIGEYNTTLAVIASFKAELEGLQEQFRLLGNLDLRAWVESLIEVSGAMDFYDQQVRALEGAKDELKAYRKACLDPVLTHIFALFSAAEKAAFEAAVKKLQNIPVDYSALELIDFVVTFSLTKPGVLKERYLKEAVKIYLVQLLLESADLARAEALYANYNKLTKEVAALADQKYKAIYNEILEGVAEAINFVSGVADSLQANLNSQVQQTLSTIPDVLNRFIAEHNIPFTVDDIKNWIQPMHKLIKVYEHYHNQYSNLKDDYYQLLAATEGIAIPDAKASFLAVRASYQRMLQAEIEIIGVIEAPKLVKERFDELKGYLKAEVDSLENYKRVVNELSGQIEKVLAAYINVAGPLYEEYERLLADIKRVKEELKNPEKIITNFFAEKIRHIQDELDKEKAKLIAMAKGDSRYQALLETVTLLDRFKQKLNALTRQKLEYNFKTKKFRKASLAGVIDFVPQSGLTELNIHVQYDIQLNINSLDAPPTVGKQSHITDSSLSNFKLGLLQLLFVDFERVRFVTGSDVKDDFQVQIRNVEFAGFLGFFQAFQEYLKSLSDNFVFEITAQSASIGYGITIPDITAGAFNFFNLSLNGLFTLPFHPEKSMQLEFGIGNELNKFGLTVMAIFGGQGYFNIIAEPKLGIVGMVVVLEFGAIFNLNLGVAKGTVYLVGGIYIKLYKKKYELRGYILCVGRLRIVGLFSASVTFYLGLEGNSQQLEGVCRVTVSHKFSEFFTLEVSFEMRKVIKSARKKQESEQKKLMLATGFALRTNNLDKELYFSDESLTLTVEDKPGFVNTLKLKVISSTDGSEHKLDAKSVERGTQQVVFPLSLLDPGDYELVILENDMAVGRRYFSLADHQFDSNCPQSIKAENDVTLKNYYSSYF